MRCDKCKKKRMALNKFRHELFVTCRNCNTGTHFDSRAPVKCRQCGSRSFTILSLEESPPFPATFGTALEPKSQDWCVDVTDDVQFLVATVRGFRTGAGFHSTCLHLVDFFLSLHRRGKYEDDSGLRSELLNAAATLLRQVFRETGDLAAGLRSIEIMEAATASVSDDLSIALYSHNVAAYTYSILAKKLEPIANAMTRRDLRSDARRAAQKALDLYPKSQDLDPQVRSIKCTEVEWLMGDIIGADSPGDAALKEAITWYDRALAREEIPADLANKIRESRLAQIRKMGTSTLDGANDRLYEEIIDSNGPSTDLMQNLQQYHFRAKQARSRGDEDGNLENLCQAYGLVRAELCSSSRDAILRNYGSQITGVVISLAKAMSELRSMSAALAVLEDFRSFAIWEKDSHDEIAQKSAKIALAANLAKLLEVNQVPAFNQAQLEEAEDGLARSLQELFSQPDVPEVIVVLEKVGAEELILECRRGESAVAVHGRQPSHDETSTDGFARLLVSVSANDTPGRVRTDRVNLLVVKASEIFGDAVFETSPDPMEPMILVTSSLRIPFEAMPALRNSNLPAKPIRYAPSVRIAAAMAKSWGGRKARRILGIGYKGNDLPGVRAELDNIRAKFGAGAKILTGEDLSRASLLAVLAAEEFDVVHFSCHGEFDATDPLSSSMLFDNSVTSEEDRITARDLLTLESLESRPLIVMSACSSALVSNNGSGNYLGLTGAFLRLGVSGIVGTRWKVADDVALTYTNLFYDCLAQGRSPGSSATFTQNALKRILPLDDWCSFILIGA